MSELPNGWELEYKRNGEIWGNQPSELAKITVDFLLDRGISGSGWKILDIGCGYGRDDCYLCSQLNCSTRAIDTSYAAIQIAQKAIRDNGYINRVDYLCESFIELKLDKQYDAVFVSNLYHLLQKDDRENMREIFRKVVKPGGFLFLNTLSVNDCEEYGKGIAVLGEEHSFQGEKYFHFSSQEELEKEFEFVQIHRLYEHQYIEYRMDRNHHHVTWILIGQV